MSLFLFVKCNYFGDQYYFLTPDERSEQSQQRVKESFEHERFSKIHYDILEDALLLDAKNDRAHYELAFSSLLLGQIDKWKTNIDAAVSLNPEKWKIKRAYHYLAYLNEFDEALLDLYGSNLLDTSQIVGLPFLDQDFLIGVSFFARSQNIQAEAFIKKHIEQSESLFIDPSAYLYLSKIAYQQNNHEAALKHIQSAFSNHENYSEFYFMKSLISIELGDLETAKRTIKKAIEQWKIGFHLKEKHQQIALQLDFQSLLKIEHKISSLFK